MTTRDIRTYHPHTVCDVCGRTLLRGERAETYINGGARREVCELCKSRALHEGWVREGTLPSYDDSGMAFERRRSILGRFRQRRDPGRRAVPTLDDELSGNGWEASEPPPEPVPERRPAPAPRPASASAPAPVPAPRRRRTREVIPSSEPRHVRAIPSSDEQKMLSAVEVFNGSEHRRTISGVARSLGGPSVCIAPSAVRPSLVNVVVSWELCWYRYEIDLSDEVPAVRLDGQGYELGELSELERLPNAVADETGLLTLQ